MGLVEIHMGVENLIIWAANRAIVFSRRVGYNWRTMEPIREIGRVTLILGVVLVGIGALLYFGGKLPFRLGRLPGDIHLQGRHGSFYFPIVTCILLSAALSLIFWVIGHFRR